MEQGHTLGGGGGGGGGSSDLSREDVRRRRLAALEEQQQPQPAAAARQPQSVSFQVPPENDYYRAASVLSQQQQQQAAPKPPPPAPPPAPAVVPVPLIFEPAVTSPAPPSSVTVTSSVFTDVEKSSFHSIMWDTSTTTEHDKLRWLSQGVDLRSDTPAQDVSIRMLSSSDNNENRSTSNSVVSESLLSWGLVQQHGGPCGVLAALQAELLRHLLFQEEQQQQDNDIGDDSNNGAVPTSSPAVAAAGGRSWAWTQLARAIATILARAAVTPSANAEAASTTQQSSSAVRIVLPRHRTALTWQDLDATTNNRNLVVYTISVPRHPTLNTTTSPTTSSSNANNNNNNNNNNNTMKRQKIQGGDSNSQQIQQQSPSQQLSQHEQEENELQAYLETLALAVSNFLETPLPRENYQDEEQEEKQQDTTAAALVPPLDCFLQQQGGVLLLVLSLVASRGASRVQQEFDDQTTCKLTAQFGHCSQELINLLLTGQAVSNVFDNTMPLGGNLVCRGIQARPNVGYLTQLEALRYVQVGGYYKSPKYPVWVVGSTSHFTVLFGQRAALQESPSDVLLEKCRRAFKMVEGGDENGFIAAHHLGQVYETLQLVESLGSTDEQKETALQMLTAHMQVAEAGIILWDDFWKATSRLMTGASVETVLQGNSNSSSNTNDVSMINDDDSDVPPPLVSGDEILRGTMYVDDPTMLSTFVPAGASAAASSIETDEEMAQRLNREYNEGFHDTISSTASNAHHQGPTFQIVDNLHHQHSGMSALGAVAARAATASPMEVETHFDAAAAAASATGNNNNASSANQSPTFMTDEELARKLQAEWDAEARGIGIGIGGGSSTAAIDGDDSPPPLLLPDRGYCATPPPISHMDASAPVALLYGPEEEDAKPAAKDFWSTTSTDGLSSNNSNIIISSGGGGKQEQKQEFEQYGQTFSLYHYNGLRGGILTRFCVTRLTAEEAVGASIALNRSASGTGIAGNTDRSGDLEDVVRTKWPSCIIRFPDHFGGHSPPSID